jgi:hypothetical protein
MTGKALFAGDGKHGGGIETAGKQNDSRFHPWDVNKAATSGVL